MRFRRTSLFLVPFLVAVTVSHAQGTHGGPGDSAQRSLPLGPSRDVTTADAVQRSFIAESGPVTANERVTFSLSSDGVLLYPSPLEGYDHAKVGELRNHGQPGQPQLPMKTIVLTLPKGAVIREATLVSGRIAPVSGRMKPVPAPEPAAWVLSCGQGEEYLPDPIAYGTSAFAPGRFLDFDTGSDREHSYCFLRIYPLQWNPVEHEALLLIDAEIEVLYELNEREDVFNGRERTDAECVILCPEILQAQAEDLASFHELQEGISSEVVTTEWISANYAEAEDPSEPGYAQQQPDFIQGYDYSLAKRIIAYLRDDGAHPDLAYITILGDAGLVPPSYYTNVFGYPVWYLWPPTDLFYASPEYDHYPDFHLGRLPVSNAAEATDVLNKIYAWHATLDWSWFSGTAVTGGNPFDSYQYHGELICVDPINRGHLTGHEIDKYFVTDDRFTSSQVLPLLSDGELGLVHQILHGSGDAIWFDDHTNISSQDLTSLPQCSRLPIVTCIACVCGAWDSDLVPSMGFSTSYGEGVLKSAAGGIAYIGGARSNAGTPTYYIDAGNLIIDREEYMADLLTRVYDSYHLGAATLGELYTVSVDSFVVNNPMWNIYNRWTLFCAVLLGDPVLGLPAQIPGDEYTVPFIEGQEPDYYNAVGFPTFHMTQDDSLLITPATTSPSAVLKIVQAEDLGPAIYGDSLDGAPFEFFYVPESGPHFSLARVTTEDEKEGWRYINTTTGLIAIDGSKSDWEAACIEPIASDPPDFDPITWDVRDLYITDDDVCWYFGFDAYDPCGQVGYGIALDCVAGGFTGIEGTDQDALDNWITFSEEHPVDFEIYYVRGVGVAFEWQDEWPAAWEGELLWGIGGASSFDAAQTQFVELSIPKSYIGDPDAIAVTLFSSGTGLFWINPPGDCQPAQDACPSDPATFHSPHWGQSNANTISEFVIAVPGVQGIQQPSDFADGIVLCGARPNPFSGCTKLVFDIPSGDELEGLRVYDVSGRLMADLLKGLELRSGMSTCEWDGRDTAGRKCPRGVYHCRLEVEGEKSSTRLVLIR